MEQLKAQLINQIKKQKLSQKSFEFIVAKLSVYNNVEYDLVERALKSLVVDGKLNPYNVSDEAIKLGKGKGKNKTQDGFEYEKFFKGDPKKHQKNNFFKVEGKIQATQKGYAFLIPYNTTMSDIFIAGNNLNGAMNNDIVVVEAQKDKNYGKMEGTVVRILERGVERIVGRINLTKTGATVVPDDVKFGKDIFIPLKGVFDANDGDKVVVKIDRYAESGKSAQGSVIEVLGKPNQIETEIKAIIRSYDLYENFPKKVSEAAENIPTEVDYLKHKSRADLTNQLIFTIDGEDTRDIDDAISLTITKEGNYRLGVHIADVGEYVTLNSIIDKEAFKRGTSVYFPNLVLPMLPRELSNGICSLNEGVYRLALSCIMDINKKGDVVDYKICESIIKSKKRFTYTEIYKIYKKEPEATNANKEFNDTIFKMFELSSILNSRRIQKGYIELDVPETKVVLDNLGNVIDVDKREQNEAHKLIETFMVAANETVAKLFVDKKLPFVYRVHETPSVEKMDTFIKTVKGFGINVNFNADGVKPINLQEVINEANKTDYKYVINKMCLRSLKKAKYSPDCLGHFGLASDFYCHFTSPIRRYPDLTIHRIIKDYLAGKLVGKTLTETKNFVKVSSITSSETEMVADKAERDIDDLYRVFYMQQHLNEEFEGKISSVMAFGVFVELPNTVEGLLRLEDLPADKYTFSEEAGALMGTVRNYCIGDTLKVKAFRADILSREIDFLLA